MIQEVSRSTAFRRLAGAGRLVSRLAARLRPVLDLFPATMAGLFVLGLCAAGFWYLGVLHKDVVLLPATLVLALLGVGMILAVGLGAAVTARALRHTHFDDAFLRLEANYARRTGIRWRVPLLPFIELSWEWLTPPDVEVRTVSHWRQVFEEVLPRRRCLVDRLIRRVQVRDVLGMARVVWRFERPSRVMILPDRGRLDQTTVLRSLVGGEDHPDPYGDAHGDRVEMRQYAPGDSARNILWKVFARNRRLMVRMPERALSARPRTCAYLVAGPSDEPSAGLARVVLEHRMLGEGWRFGADGSPGFADNLDSALELLARSGNPDAGPPGLAAFLKRAEIDGYQNCLVFLPAASGDWLDEVRQVAAGSRLSLTWMLGLDGLQTGLERPTLWKRLLLRPEPTTPADPLKVAESLQSTRTPMVLCDRKEGRVVTDARQFYKVQARVDRRGTR
jgi:hypothetical protein